MKPARICIVGGIFDRPPEYRQNHSISPETVLADGLRERGVPVETVGHSRYANLAGYDLVHIHHLGKAAVSAALFHRGARMVFTSHDPFLMNGYPTGWKRALAARLVLRRADAVIALSGAESRVLATHFGVSPNRTHVIPNGIDSHIFGTTTQSVSAGRPLILCVGQLQAFKGIDYLLDAMRYVRACSPDALLMFVHQSDGELVHYRELARRLGVSEAIEFAGPRNPVQLAELYATASVVVSASLGECLSTVVLEAMFGGAAVVATDVGGIREQIPPGRGLIVPPRDSRALANAIWQLLSDPKLRTDMGSAARAYARSTYTVPSMIDSHIALYEELLEGAPLEDSNPRWTKPCAVR